jgi:hypothetical protein
MEDERLTGDANEAGYRWAERRLLTDDTNCPEFSPAFRTGCIAYVIEQNDNSGRWSQAASLMDEAACR